jgi:hypothetical protein
MADMSVILSRTSPRSKELKDILDDWRNVGEIRVKNQYKTLCALYGKNINDGQRRLDIPQSEIKDTGEKAYQRAFFKHGKTILKTSNPTETKKVEWLDYEVPVIFSGSARRTSLDLIGKIADNAEGAKSEYAIAEIKDIKGNSPFYAIFEVLEYALLIKNLVLKGVKPPYHSINNDYNDYWGDYLDCKYLIIGAPDAYWIGKWHTHIDKFKTISGWIKDTFGYQVVFAKYGREDFRNQRGNNETYIPSLKNNKSNIWTIL